MLDFSFIGKEAFVIQYEDLISLIGWNVVERYKDDNDPDKREERLLAYLNRESFDISSYIKQHTNVDVPNEIIMCSKSACTPNLAYAFKMMQASYQNGIKRLYVHSNTYSPVIEKFIQNLEIKTNYVHGDIIPVLHNLPNCTYTTSDPNNIRKCVDVDVPIALTIVDDFPYLSNTITDQSLLRNLEKANVYVQYTGVLSAGFIPYFSRKYHSKG